MPERILLLGVGNILLGDEGFGVHALRYLEKEYALPENFRLLDGGTLGLLLMAELLECDLAIILDIALGGKEPGTFYRIEGDDLGARSLPLQSLHQTSLADVLISCELAEHRPKAIVFAMEPFGITGPQAALSLEAEQKLPAFCAKVIEELIKDGYLPACVLSGAKS